MAYRPREYWEARGANYPYETRRETSLEDITKLLDFIKPVSLLDVGCGYGRLFDLYRDVSRVLAVDFSESMLKHARETVERLNLWKVELRCMNAESLGFLEEKFELVLSRNVLMHVPPRNIWLVVQGMKKVCDGYIALVEYTGSSKKLSPHIFSHEYERLFSDMWLESRKNLRYEQTFFLFRRGNNNC